MSERVQYTIVAAILICAIDYNQDCQEKKEERSIAMLRLLHRRCVLSVDGKRTRGLL